jgi:hypothetical protein
LNFETPPEPRHSHATAEHLREQAASCRRLASTARTRGGTKALDTLADHFDEQANRLDPLSLRR